MVLLDTNIMIYIIQENQKILHFLDDLYQDEFFVSVITRMECLVGPDQIQNDRLRFYLDQCRNLPIDAELVDLAAKLYHEYRPLKFKDALIAATAKMNKMTLVTADRMFGKIKGLTVSVVGP